MRGRIFTFLVAAVGVIGMAGVALATHDEPSQAKKFQTAWITGYKACTAPNQMTTGTPSLPACSAVREDAACGFGGVGKGKLKGKISGSGASQVISLSGQMSGLTGCDGLTLAFVATVRATSDGCDTPPCTTLDALTTDFPTGIACGPVAAGACKFSGTVGPPLLTPGANLGLSLEGFSLTNGAGVHSFVAGQLYP